MAIEYTTTECEEHIKYLNGILLELAALPTQSGGDGVYASFIGKSSELRAERAVWEKRYTDALRRETSGLASDNRVMNGPDFEVY